LINAYMEGFMCVLCKKRLLTGQHKYCATCAKKSKTINQRKRRRQMRKFGVPAWKRSGWTSLDLYRKYQRQYMQIRRARMKDSDASPQMFLSMAEPTRKDESLNFLVDQEAS
jgi:hypothetical protein